MKGDDDMLLTVYIEGRDESSVNVKVSASLFMSFISFTFARWQHIHLHFSP